ncbi:MAG: TonB-dependent receptor [Tannerellaceae bacterium]|jgi:TonB-linked SusC/RagA family outer membrane protein|nr:TonB-dependent receptor [Tannerellaceae bacterium]
MKKQILFGISKARHRNLIRIVKCCLLFIFLGTGAIFADETYSQKTFFTLEYSSESVKNIIRAVEQQSEYIFFYLDNSVDLNRKVAVKVQNGQVEEILRQLFAGTNNRYHISDRQIVIFEENQRTEHLPFSLQQSRTITGVVQDALGPIIGANVMVKGTTTGAVTDMNGRFTISDLPANVVLQISYVGYISQELTVTNQTHITVTLVEDTRQLDDVVVVGYGTTKRSDLVSSATSVSLADVKSVPSERVDNMLQGRSTGLLIQNTSASPNPTYNIRIRGSNSISGSNDPLIVVDGFIGGDMGTINPNDIESIEVLKDASATAIYGSRGANGVILIQTKRGKSQKPVVEVNSFLSFMSVAKKLERLNAGQYAELVNEVRETFGQNQVFTAQQISDFYAKGGTDWQSEIFRNALQQSHQVSVAGGGDKTSYYLSGNIVDNTGIVRGSSFERYNIRSNISTQLNNKLKAGLNLFFDASTFHPNNMSRDANPVNGAEGWAPTLPVYNPDGTYTLPAATYGPKSIYNPVANALEPIYDNRAFEFQLNTYLDYEIIKGLTARILFGARLRDGENSRFTNTKAQGGTGNSSASVTNNRFSIIQNTEQLNYVTTIGDIHNLNLTLAIEQQIENNNASSVSTEQFITDALSYNNLALGAIPGVPTSSRTKRVIQSFVGRANYSLKDKYLFSFTGRYDGSSVFGSNHKWGFFPSGAFAWRVNNEKFLDSIDELSNLKLRVSYGITGSQALAPYATLAQLSTTLRYSNAEGSDWQPGVGFSTLANPDLQWEKTKQFNLGIDIGLFKQRLQLTVDYYNKHTSDLLYQVPVPRASGYLNRIENIGEVGNYGFEFSLGSDPFVGKFKWNTNLSLSFNRNKVVALASGEKEVGFDRIAFMDLLPGFGNTVFLIVGQPIGVIKGYVQDGTWGTHEAAEAAKYGVIPGAPKYEDQNGDGAITVDDMAILGSPLPKFTYGWNNTFSYKDFSLGLFLQGVQGNKIYNIARIRAESQVNNIGQDVTDSRILNRWTPENQNTDVPSIAGSIHEKLQSSRWMEDGSYLRVKNVTLGYYLPSSILRPLGINSVRVYVSGQNLLTVTKFTGWDPEGRSERGVSSDLFGGVAIATYPAQRGYTVGLNIIF